MTYNLFIDDERDPINVTWGSWLDQGMYRHEDWIIARTWDEVLDILITMGMPKMVSFDHDLGEGQKTGYEIAKKMCDMVMDGMRLPEDFDYRVHSKNPVGKKNIEEYMRAFLNYQSVQY